MTGFRFLTNACDFSLKVRELGGLHSLPPACCSQLKALLASQVRSKGEEKELCENDYI